MEMLDWRLEMPLPISLERNKIFLAKFILELTLASMVLISNFKVHQSGNNALVFREINKLNYLLEYIFAEFSDETDEYSTRYRKKHGCYFNKMHGHRCVCSIQWPRTLSISSLAFVAFTSIRCIDVHHHPTAPSAWVVFVWLLVILKFQQFIKTGLSLHWSLTLELYSTLFERMSGLARVPTKFLRLLSPRGKRILTIHTHWD